MTPDPHAIATMALTVFALILFTRDRIPLETSSLLILVMLTLGFELFPYYREGSELHAHQLLLGFGHEALVAVCALMIAGHGLVRTGALEPVGRSLSRAWVNMPKLSFLLTLLIGAFFSAFVNNVPIVVLLLPILISVSLRTSTSASGVLMPMGFATLIGGMGTTIGTSTNLLVVSVATDMGLRKFDMFDFVVPVLIAGSLAMIYLWLIAPKLLPTRKEVLSDTSPRVFTAQLLIGENSKSIDQRLSELIAKTDEQMTVTRILRGNNTQLISLPDISIKDGDRLVVTDTAENLKDFENLIDAQLWSGDAPVDDDNPLNANDQKVAEIVVTQGSSLENSTLSLSHFTHRYQLTPLALHCAGWKNHCPQGEIHHVRLKVGDIVLVQGDSEQLKQAKQQGDILVLDDMTDVIKNDHAWKALLIMAAIILPAAFGLMPIVFTALAGVLLMIMTHCLSWRDAVRALSSQVILIVVASLALGSALLKTGAADYLAHLFVQSTQGIEPIWMLSGLMMLMAILTNIVSNNAAALIGTPIAIGIAQQLQLPAEPFVLAVLFGANMSYATPIAYKTNLLVMNAGGYRFSDFLRVGIPLTLLMWGSFTWLLPVFYDLS